MGTGNETVDARQTVADTTHTTLMARIVGDILRHTHMIMGPYIVCGMSATVS